VTKWGADGTERWTIGRHWHGERVDPTGSGRGSQYPRGTNVATPPVGVLHAPCGLLGTTHGAVVVADRSWLPAHAWTKDGLYAGYFLDAHVDDEYPEWVYHWWRDPESNEEALINPDCLHKGAIAERENGEVIWFAPGRNSLPVYRIHGWDGWERTEGTVTIESQPASASADGSGLQGTYFDSADADLGGSPTAERVDDQVWFAYETRFNEVTQWNEGVVVLDGQTTDFAARWTGEVEGKLSEPTTFSVYANGVVRLSVDGETVIEHWDEEANYRVPSEPLELEAGERYPIRLDFRTTQEQPRISLNWDSFSQERERIPTAHLYPGS
jgi:hypothetical protein